MRAGITSWCQGCLICATRHVGQSLRPLLTPIPEEGPFHRVAVDVLQLPVSAHGNKYAIYSLHGQFDKVVRSLVMAFSTSVFAMVYADWSLAGKTCSSNSTFV